MLFGRVADMLGRKRIYGYEVLVLAAGAVASAFSPDIWWLIAFRVVLGIGIGGDYPVSATIMSEYAGKQTRGMMVTLVFTMQAAGLIVGPLLAAGLLVAGLPHDLVWRLLLAFGAVPAMAVFQMRRNLAETPRYLLAAGRHAEFRAAAGDVLAAQRARGGASRRMARRPRAKPSFRGLRQADQPARPGDAADRGEPRLVPDGLRLLRQYREQPDGAERDHARQVLLMTRPDRSLRCSRVAAVPGYLVAAAMMDRMGRKSIQVLGFAMMALSFAAMALIPGIEKLVVPFLLIYGISYFFTEFGPNATTFVYPAELFPVEARTTGHGIASAAGKLGGFIGVFLFPDPAELARPAVRRTGRRGRSASSGSCVTVWLLPETKGRSLEELSLPAQGLLRPAFAAARGLAQGRGD